LPNFDVGGTVVMATVMFMRAMTVVIMKIVMMMTGGDVLDQGDYDIMQMV
jgi:hypothetical protein